MRAMPPPSSRTARTPWRALVRALARPGTPLRAVAHAHPRVASPDLPACREPDGIEAAYTRLLDLEAREADTQGLEPTEVDRRLWAGAATAGWRVRDNGRNDGHYVYTAPSGLKYTSKGDAFACPEALAAKRGGC